MKVAEATHTGEDKKEEGLLNKVESTGTVEP